MSLRVRRKLQSSNWFRISFPPEISHDSCSPGDGRGGGGWRVHRISSDRDDGGIFWGRKILASIFSDSLISLGFFGVFKTNVLSFVVLLSGNLYGLEIRRGIFWGLNLGPGIFCFCFCFEAQEIFLGFDFCPNSIIPVT